MNKLLLFLFVQLFYFSIANAQFTAIPTPGISATQLVQKFAGDGILVSNATLSCPNGASGTFVASATSLGIDSGISLTTGALLTYTSGTIVNYGVNSAATSYAKVDNLTIGGDADLATSSGQPITSLHDMCKLEFDFIPLGDTLKFQYKFGSEEYPDFNCSQFSDIFGFYITSGPGYPLPTNIALIPGTSIPVSVNSINNGTTLFGNPVNCSSLGIGSPFTSLYQNNNTSSTIVYNGLTQLLQATAIVTPCSTYHLKIAIADLGDGDRDSGVFLKAGSLKSEAATIDSVKNTNSVSLNTPFIIEGCNPDTVFISRPIARPTPQIIPITYGGTAVFGSDFTAPTSVTIPANGTVASFNLNAILDNINEGTENIKIYIYGSPCIAVITDSIVISLLEYPLYNISNNDTICTGQSATLSANNLQNNPLLNFTWNPRNSNGNSFIVSPITTSNYTVTAKYPGCPNKDSIVTISVAPIPIVNAGPNLFVCNGSSNMITAVVTNFSPYGITYQWSPTTGINNSIVINPIFNPSSTTTYTLTATSSAGCVSTDAVIINVNPPLIISTTINNSNCNNQALGSITTSVSGTIGTINYTLQPGAFNNTTGIFNSLSANTYTITATNSIGCSITSIVTIAQPAALQINPLVVTQPTCNGFSNGLINISAIGGSGSITYSSIPTLAQATSGLLTGVSATTYTLIATDANGCAKTTTTIVSQPSLLNWSSVNQTNVTCNGLTNGSITASISGGTFGYSYSITPATQSNNTGFFNTLNAGIYTITGTDANGCTKTSTVNLIQPNAMIFNNPTIVNPSCIPGNNGSISITANGGIGTKTYSINPGTTSNTSGNFAGLGIGAFVITVTDANGCTKTTVANLSYANAPSVASNIGNPVSCFGNTNGTILTTATGGNGVITFTLNPGSISNSTGSFTNLATGVYSVSITDVSGCTSFSTVTVSTPVVLTIPTLIGTNPLCNSSINGNITTTINGGTPNYNYVLNPGGTANSTGNFSNLISGNYTVQVTDSKGCISTKTVALTNPPILMWNNNFTSTNILCNGASTGSIGGSASGGSGIITYQLAPGGISNSTGTFTNLSANLFTITAIDANNCTVTRTVTLTQNPPIVLNTISSTPASCNPGGNGSLTLSGSGGIGTPYSFTLNSNTNTTGIYTSLNGGVYTITVQDGIGCTRTGTAIVPNQNGPVITQLLYNLNDICVVDSSDSIQVIATGSGLLTYTLIPIGTTNNSGFFNGLANGSYTVNVIDATGCSAVTAFVINEPDSLVMNIVSSTIPLCVGNTIGSITVGTNGGTAPFLYTNLNNGLNNASGIFTNLLIGSYSIMVIDSNGCKDTTLFNVPAPIPIVINNVIKTNVLCYNGSTGVISIIATGGSGGLTFTRQPGNINNATGIFNNLIAGNYTITIRDANNCSISTIVNITQGPFFAFSTISNLPPSCTNPTSGVYTITSTGGIGSITFSLNSTNNATGIFTGLSAGTYTLKVTDAVGCTLTQTSTLLIPNGVSASATITTISCYNGTNGAILITPINGQAPYSYSFNNGSFNTTNNYPNLGTGTYTIVVKDALNCTFSVVSILINPSLLTVTQTNNNVTCFNGNNGNIAASSNGGTGAINYNIMPGNFNNTTGNFSNLTAGNYTIVVTDTKACSSTIALSISQGNQMVIGIPNLTSPTCVPNNNGSISVTSTGGNGLKTYSLSNAGTNNTGLFNGLIASIYTLTVTDANGCSITSTINLTSTVGPNITTLNSTNVSCYGGNNGNISVNATSTNGAITYSISPNNSSNSTGIFNNLSSATYTITVNDAAGCLSSTIRTINQPTQFFINLNNSSSPSCNSGTNGSINIFSTGGFGIINYTLTPGSITNSTGLFTNLASNTYTISALDGSNCNQVTTVTLINPTAIVWNSFITVPVLCFGQSTGSITAYATGGTGSLNYVLNPGNNSNSNGTFSSLIASNYTLTISDGNNCTISSSTIITQPSSAITILNASNTIPSCVPGNDATIITNANGGTGVISYTIGNVNNINGIFNNIGSATYTIIVSDANGCMVTSSIQVNNPSAPNGSNFTIDSTTCFGGNDGGIIINTTGGLGPINYTIIPSNISNFTGNFSNLSAQTYTVTLIDSVGCSSIIYPSIAQPTGISFNTNVVSSALCFGGTGNLNAISIGGIGVISVTLLPNNITNTTGTFNNLPASTYTLLGTDALGCTGSTIESITTPPALYWSAFNSVNVVCNTGTNGIIAGNVRGGSGAISYNLNPGNITDTTGIFLNLPAAIYTIIATDANGCTISTICNVTQPTQLSFSTLSATIPTCVPGNDATITAVASGGSPSYLYSLNNGLFQTSSVYSNIGIAIYTVTIKDNQNCTYSSVINVANPGAPSIQSITTVTPLCFGNSNGSITVNATGGTGNLIYKLMPNNVNNTTGIFTNLLANTFTITVTDAGNCIATSIVILTQPTILLFDTLSKINPTCFGGTNGVIKHSTSGGTGLVTFTINPGNYVTTNDSSANLNANTYTIIAVDLNGCSTSSTIVINNPPQIIVNPLGITTISCFGGNNGAINITANGGTGGLTYTLNPGNIQNTSGGFTGLVANTIYSIQTKDANNCSVNSTTTINQPSALALTVTNIIAATCLPGSDGSFAAVGTGGIGIYNFNLSPVGLNNSNGNFTNINNGNYTITLTDANSCTTSSTLILIQPNNPIITNITYIPAKCNPLNTGSITIFANNGNSPYTYQINTGSFGSSNTFNNLIANNYTATVKDINGCTSSSSINVLTTVGVAITNTSTTNPLCFNSNNGSINVTAGIGTLPYSFTLNPTNTNNSNGVFLNIGPAVYTINVVDGNGCTTITNLTITQPQLLQFNNVTSIGALCNGANNGSILVTTSGGTNPTTFSINPINTQTTSGNFINLIGNASYTVSAIDVNNCTTSTTVFVSQPNPLAITSTAKTDVTCAGFSNGTMSINATGGTGTKIFSLSPSSQANSTGQFAGLSGNTYTVTITDANNCTITTTIFVYEPPSIIVTSNTNTPVTCFGDADATATIVANGGVGGLNYLLMPLNTNNNTGLFTNLGGNVYTITIKDTNNCFITVTTTTLEPALLKIDSLVVANIVCNGAGNGSISTLTSGGNGQNLFGINPTVFANNTSGVFSPLVPNNYTINVTDSKGCTTSANTSIIQPTPIQFILDSFRNITCNSANNGYIYTHANGGANPYLYTILPSNSSNTSGAFFNLGTGIYTILATDNNGCIDSIPNISITQPPAIKIDSVRKRNVICYSNVTGRIDIFASGGIGTYTFTLQPINQTNVTGIFDSLISATYTIAIVDAGGCTTISTIFVDQNAELILANQTNTPAICYGQSTGSIEFSPTGGVPPYIFSINGGPFSADTFYNNLPSGSYYIYIKDSFNCTNDTTVFITQPDSLQLFINSTNDLYCFPLKTGSIEASAIGGNTISAYTYLCLPINKITNDGIFTDLGLGNYYVQVVDTFGCKTTLPVNIAKDIDSINTIISSTSVTCLLNGNDGTATVQVLNGQAPYTYLWSNLPNGKDSTIDSLTFGIYYVNITDSFGCKVTDTVIVQPATCCDLYMPNAFTPNADTWNDTYKPIVKGSVDNVYFAIYDRWGTKVFSTVDITKGWDGKYKGQLMDLETYFYVISYTCSFDKTRQFKKGDVTLLK